MHRRTDQQRRVEALAVRGERQHERPPARVSCRATTGVAPRCDPHGCRCGRRRSTSSVSGTPARMSAWRTCQPTVVATASASGPGSDPMRRAGLRQQVQHAEFGEHVARANRARRRRAQPTAGFGWRGCRPARRRAGRRADPTCRSGPAPGPRARCASGRRATGRVRPARRTSARPAHHDPVSRSGVGSPAPGKVSDTPPGVSDTIPRPSRA